MARDVPARDRIHRSFERSDALDAAGWSIPNSSSIAAWAGLRCRYVPGAWAPRDIEAFGSGTFFRKATAEAIPSAAGTGLQRFTSR